MADEKSKFDLFGGARHALRGFRKSQPSAAAEQVLDRPDTVTVSREKWRALCAAMNAAHAEAEKSVAVDAETDSGTEPSEDA